MFHNQILNIEARKLENLLIASKLTIKSIKILLYLTSLSELFVEAVTSLKAKIVAKFQQNFRRHSELNKWK